MNESKASLKGVIHIKCYLFHDYYLTGVAEYNGKKYWYAVIDLEAWEYALYDLSADEMLFLQQSFQDPENYPLPDNYLAKLPIFGTFTEFESFAT